MRQRIGSKAGLEELGDRPHVLEALGGPLPRGDDVGGQDGVRVHLQHQKKTTCASLNWAFRFVRFKSDELLVGYMEIQPLSGRKLKAKGMPGNHQVK